MKKLVLLGVSLFFCLYVGGQLFTAFKSCLERSQARIEMIAEAR